MLANVDNEVRVDPPLHTANLLSGLAITLTLMDLGALDSISFLVWIQCDGKTTANAIADVFAVSGNVDIVRAAIKGVLDKLETSGLIKWI